MSELVARLREAMEQERAELLKHNDPALAGSAELDLRDSQALLRAVTEGVTDAVFIKDAQSRYLMINGVGARWLGKSTPAEVLGRDDAALFDPETAAQIRANDQKIMTEGRALTFEETRTAAGLTQTYLTFKSPYRDEEGRVAGVLGIVHDITERKQAEQSQRNQAALIDLSPDAIIVRSFEGTIHFWSKGAEELYGWTSAEAVGNTTQALLRTKFPIPFDDMLTQMERDGFWSGELIHTARDGRQVVVASLWVIQRDEQGHPVALMECNVDITARRRAEEDLRHLYEELEDRVAQRTAELAAANRELEAFSYSISHDLRAPLRHIMSFVELFGQSARAGLNEKERRYLQVISEAAGRMRNLIDDLLTFSRIGRATLDETRVSLRQLVTEARRDLAPETEGRAIEWTIGPLPEVRGDPILLRTVVVNLLSNAIKYTRPRNPARIEVGAYERDGEWVCFVRDNGAGFDMNFVDKLFGVFQRLHRSEDFEGSGIGLASVRRIIQRHGGRTWAEGVVDGGATFYFSFPGKKVIGDGSQTDPDGGG